MGSKYNSGPGAGGPTCDKSGSGAKKFHHQTLPVLLPQPPPDLAGAWLAGAVRLLSPKEENRKDVQKLRKVMKQS